MDSRETELHLLNLFHEDIAAILRALGMHDGARSMSAHQVIHKVIIPRLTILKAEAAEFVGLEKHVERCHTLLDDHHIATGGLTLFDRVVIAVTKITTREAEQVLAEVAKQVSGGKAESFTVNTRGCDK